MTHGNTGQKRLASNYISDFALDLWCCCSEFERKIIIQAGCSPEKAVVTGMARYDAIPVINADIKEQNPKKIMIMPTWREWYLNGDKRFVNTDLYQRYNDIILFCKATGYEVTFVLHNKFSDYYHDDLSKIWSGIRIVESSANIKKELMENDLLITDYSSVLWEFIYQNKPILLYWYDVKEYNALSGKIIHSGGTYPEFEELMKKCICYNSEEIKRKLEDCKKRDELQCFIIGRKQFFTFTDQHNCQRIYLEIEKKLGEKYEK